MSILAVNGGTPLYELGCMKTIPWPPVSDVTADHLRELYLSRAWSFNSQTEQDFEKAYAAYQDARFGVFMTNGTVTLECALLALGVGPGDEVIVPGLTWMATAMAVHYVGATVVFADVEPDTLCLDPSSVDERITERTKAIIPVHLYGSMADLEKLLAIAKKHGIAIIEDCAHMQGGKWAGKGAGSWGDVGSFSFQQSKTLSCGEGGICITNDEKLALRIYRAKHIGYSPSSQQGNADAHPDAGLYCHNYRGLAFPALILLEQLPGLDAILERYNQFYFTLKEAVADVEGFYLQAQGRLATRQGYYAMGCVFEKDSWGNVPKARMSQALVAEGMPLQLTYGPVYEHTLFNLAPEHFRNDGCPTVDMLKQCAFNLGHRQMYNLDNVEIFSKVIHKLSENRRELAE
ncbi:MAG: aminotransferase class I/II-fold pyridoxal phosphate-dependent enzyme [Victivallales bacterium]|nr:aminotransferase class I/II-fold pyridoxal phosphate-dependent enzyme [Victivallales bacterium]